LRLRVVAEGVETTEQRDHLKKLGCDEMQGYLASKPLAAVDATAFLAANLRVDGRSLRSALSAVS
jgi:EAL domain-containing protein (putative c-di-GMP-specific phosphodiesterase class I)